MPNRTEHGQQSSLEWSEECSREQSMDRSFRKGGVWRMSNRTEHGQQSSLEWSGECPIEQSTNRSFGEGWSGECPGKLTRVLNGHHLFTDHALTCLSRVSTMTARA